MPDPLKIEPRLKLDRSSGEGPLGFAKLSSVHKRTVIAKLKIIQVKLVKDVEEVGPKIEAGTFTQSPQAIQPEPFYDAEVH